MQNPSLAYRSDIDGLRAIGVLVVIAFHAFPDIVPGGFVGVDVFFVISGYLISSILLKETEQQKFNLGGFYARRIKRIFPALLLVLASSLAAGWLVLLSDEFRMLGQHTIATTVFGSNFWLWQEAGYFDVAAERKLLLHLWSLAIEEQFYVVWPLLLFLFTRQRRYLLQLVGLITLLSFISCIMHISVVERFYFPQNRAWELLLGALLACRSSAHKTAPEKSAVHANLLSCIGILLLLTSITQLSKHSIFPGWSALLPTLSAVLIIAAGKRAWINQYILGSQPMVWVGLISYPLYLWHWPLLTFARIIEGGEPTTQTRIIAIMISVVLSCLTYLLIERPLRTGGKKTIIGLIAIMISIGITGFLCGNQTFKPRSTNDNLDSIIHAFNDWGAHGEAFNYHNMEFFQWGAAGATTIFMGDSNMEQYLPRISKVITEDPDHSQHAIYATRGGCIPIRHINNDHTDRHCNEYMENAYQLIMETPDINTVVIAAQWYTYLAASGSYYYDDHGVHYMLAGSESEGSKKAYVQLEEMIQQFRNHGKKVYLILNLPFGVELDPRKLVVRSWKHLGLYINGSVKGLNKEKFLQQITPAMQPLRDIAERTGSVVLDPTSWLCDAERCSPLTADGAPIYKDSEHLNATFVKKYLSALDQTIAKEQP